jgi:hypothetical protein
MKLTKNIWYGNQYEVSRFFQSELLASGRNFQVIDHNIVCIDLQNVPCLVAHMDTVNDKAMRNPLVNDNGILSRKNSILGADDRAGCQIIFNNFKDCNFILTTDEEIGGIGAKTINKTPHIKELVEEYRVPCLLEFDRMNSGDIVGTLNDYCDHTLSQAIQKIAPDYKDAQGVFTDLDHLQNLGVQGVNLSVGYYSQHSKNEILVLSEFARANQLAGELIKGLQGHTFSRNSMETPWFHEDRPDYGFVDVPEDCPDECPCCQRPYDFDGYGYCNSCDLFFDEIELLEPKC